LIGDELRRQVVRRAFGTCQCTGVCGHRHRATAGRCPRTETPAAPLHAVPLADTGEVSAMTLKARDMAAMCGDCHTGVQNKRATARRRAAARALTDNSEELF
jgi:L-asparaginase II